MKKVLLVSWRFGESGGSAGIDILKRVSNLSTEIDVFFVSPEKIPSREILDSKKYEFLPKLNLNYIFIPESKYRTIWARKKFKNFVVNGTKSSKYSTIISHSNEVYSHHVAGILVKKLMLPWIAYFGDPVRNNPYIKVAKKYALRRLDEKIERKTLETAQRVYFNNQQTFDLVKNSYPKTTINATDICPHGYLRNSQGTKNKKNSYKKNINLVFLGDASHPLRSAKPLIDGFELLMSLHPESIKGVMLSLYGKIDSESELRITHKIFVDRIKSYSGVSYLKGQEILEKATAFISIDAIFEDGNHPFLPGKIGDYLAFNKPILGLVASNSPTATLGEFEGLFITGSHAPEQVALKLKEMLEVIRSGKTKLTDTKELKKYSENNWSNLLESWRE